MSITLSIKRHSDVLIVLFTYYTDEFVDRHLTYCSYPIPGGGVESCVGVSVCLYVCMHVSEQHVQTSTNCTCCLWPWLGPPLMALQYIIYFWFYEQHRVFTLLALWHVVYS